MTPINRRQFLRTSALGLTAVAAGARWRTSLFAEPLGLPIGLELWTVRRECEKNLEGTLRKLANIGYKEVEMFDFYNKKPSEIRRILRANGLTCPSAHFVTAKIKSGWEKHIEYAQEVGIRYMVCAILQPSERTSLDDYRRVADLFNRAGEQCQKAGIQFAYHNHNFEFKTFDGVVAYDELLRRTDAKLVQLELDCFWITRAGKDPVEYFNKYPGRFPLLHIKDLKPGYPSTVEDDFKPGPFTEVGRGIIDWARIFAAAPQAALKHYYVEQDECDRPPLDSIKISYDYLRKLKV